MGYIWFVTKLKKYCVWFGTYKKRFAIRNPELLNSIPDPSVLDVPVTKEMLRNDKASRQKYQINLEAKRLLLEKEAARKGETIRKRRKNQRKNLLRS